MDISFTPSPKGERAENKPKNGEENGRELEKLRDEKGGVRCVFSSSGGLETTDYWLVVQVDEEQYSVRPINENHVAQDEEKFITVAALLTGYVPEIDYFENKVLPAMAELEDHLKSGESDRAEGKLYSAEMHFDKALAMDELNVRALFNLGLIYLERGETAHAVDLMDSLLEIRASFDGKNQHLFNEFGIALRKSHLLDEAVSYFSHALDYVTTDENLYYNYARANYERGNWEACVRGLLHCRAINPRLEVARDLVDLVRAMQTNDALREKYDKPPIPESLAAKIEKLSLAPGAGNAKDKDIPEKPIRMNDAEAAPEDGRAGDKRKRDDAPPIRFDLD